MEEEVRIKASIEQYIHKRLNCSIGKLFQDEIFNNLKKNFAVWIKIAVDSEEVNACIFNIIDMEIEKLEKNGGTIKNIFPKGFENNLKVYVYNNSPGIISQIKELLMKKSIENKIKTEINKVIISLNPMIGKFVNADSIYSKIVQETDIYFSNPESAMKIVMAISNLIDQGMGKEINGVTMYFPYEGRKASVEFLKQGILKIGFCDEIINKILSLCGSYFKSYPSLYDLLLSLNPELDKIIKTEAGDMFDFIMSK
jgi:hypothetical protein